MGCPPLKPGWDGSTAPATIEGSPGLLADPQWEKHSFHLKPSLLAPEGNQYSDIDLLLADVQDSLIAGFACQVYVGESDTLPASALALAGVEFILPSPFVTLTIPEGCTITGAPPKLTGGVINFTGASSPFTFTGLALMSIRSCKLKASGTGPMITYADGGTLYLGADGYCELDNDGYEVFEGTGTSGIVVFGYGPLRIASDVFRGVATTSTTVELHHPDSDVSESHSNLTTAMSVVLRTAAARLACDDTNLGFAAPELQTALEAFFNGNLEWLAMNVTSGVPAVPGEGMFWWDDDSKTLSVQTNEAGVRLQVGQEQHIRITNKTGDQIDNGELVYIDGAQGNRPTAALAIADGTVASDVTIGFATHNIPDNQDGIITSFGLVRDLDTATPGFSPGDKVYLDPSTPGAWTKTPPVTPDQRVLVGYVLTVNDVAGVIFCRVHFAEEEIHALPIMSSNPSAFAESVLGHWETIVFSQLFSLAAPYTSADNFNNAEAVFLVAARSNPCTLQIDGDSVDEITGIITTGDTETIAVDATGWYRSAKKWLEKPIFSVVEAGETITADINRTRYWDASNQDFRLVGFRWEFTPSAASWSFSYTISKVTNEGTLTTLETKSFANTDSPVWADSGNPGTFKKSSLEHDFLGSENEGLVVEITSSNIVYLYGDLKYTHL